MLDLHCHLLPGVDDGAPDMTAALRLAALLAEVGFTGVAPSPHFGEGPGGDVGIEQARTARAALQTELERAGIDLELLPNAEHHVTAELYQRLERGAVVPLGGSSRWLLVELPWRAIPDVEDALFRLQARGYRLLLAHPERYSYVELDLLERLVGRDVKLQLELGSFAMVFGKRAHKHASALAERGLAHVLATDLHAPADAEAWLGRALDAARAQLGATAVRRALADNPRALVANVEPAALPPFLEPA